METKVNKTESWVMKQILIPTAQSLNPTIGWKVNLAVIFICVDNFLLFFNPFLWSYFVTDHEETHNGYSIYGVNLKHRK